MISSGKEPLKMSEFAVKTNDLMPKYAFEYLLTFVEKSKFVNLDITLLGVSYLADVGDTRYSPVEPFYRYLNQLSSDIYLYDPYVNFWEELNLSVNTSQNMDDIFKNNIDLLIFSTGHSIYKNNKKFISSLCEIDSCVIYDTIGILSQNEIKLLSKRHKVKVLGRGDI